MGHQLVWIIPKSLHTCPYVADTKELGLDCEEFSQMCEKSLMSKSKLMRWQTWSQRWKEVAYIQHLSTRTLKPSHSKTFVDKWILSQQDSHVSHSQLLQQIQKLIKTQDIYTHTSQKEFQLADQLMLFSKMSTELSLAKPGMGSRYSNMSSEIWKKEVTKLQQEYSQRVKSEHLTYEKGSSSWPTADATNVSDGVSWDIIEKQLIARRARTKIAVAEGKVKQGSGRSLNLAMAVQKERARNWATPNTLDHLPPKEGAAIKKQFETHRKGRTAPSNLREQVNPKSWPKNGHQDQARSNKNGKSRELLNPNWAETLMGLEVGWTQLQTEWID